MNVITISSVAALAILIATLGAWVTTVRLKTTVMYHGERMARHPQLAKAVRAHGNAAEYAGMLIGVSILTGLIYGAAPLETWVRVVIVVITGVRYLGAIGFLISKTLEKMHPFKAVGGGMPERSHSASTYC